MKNNELTIFIIILDAVVALLNLILFIGTGKMINLSLAIILIGWCCYYIYQFWTNNRRKF